MADLSSDSSDSDRGDDEVMERKTQDLTLNEVNDMVREYEKMEKRERKVRSDAYRKKEEVIVTPEQMAQIVLTKKQLKQLATKEKKERTEKQKESARRLLDLRKNKDEPSITLKIAPPKKRTPKPKPQEEPEEEEEEMPQPQKTKGFQAKKPLEMEDEVEQKVEKLNKLNNVLSSNPYYAQVMASRGIRF
jgi:hypothetical protein